MIQCKNISKYYKNCCVFENFSYTFNDTGLYGLYGFSGSGKTTLLNIILGVISYNGTIIYNQKNYNKQVSFDEVQQDIAYISQNNYFIDYLTMNENLTLETQKSFDEILETLKMLNIENLVNKFPNQLSGGERQRFAIAGSLLKGKRIFLLDEPTSSLDKENRTNIFKILDKLKSEVLIICATHDDTIFQFADDIVDFNHLEKYHSTNQVNNHSISKSKNKEESKKKFSKSNCLLLFKSLWKQIYRNNKKLTIIYIFVFVIALLLCFSFANYESKVFSSLVDVFHTKSVRIDCSLETGDYCSEILSNYDVSETVYHYIRNILDTEEDIRYDVLSLPYKAENIYNVEEKLLYGTYFTSKNEVILGYNEALQLAQKYNVNMKSLIGREETLLLQDGADTFKIVGIFKQMNKETAYYFMAILGQYDFDSYVYLNSEYLNKYLFDDLLGMDELYKEPPSTSLTIFFENKYSFLDFYYDYEKTNKYDTGVQIANPVDNFVEYKMMIEEIKPIFLIVSITFFTLAMLFYLLIHQTQNNHTDHYYCIYQYYGYSHKEIKYASILYFISYIGIIFLISLLAYIGISFIVNEIVVLKALLPFKVFEIKWFWIILLFIVLSLVALIEGLYLNYARKKDGWYQMLKEKSDLL